MLPYFKKEEDYHGGRSELHGYGGVWTVARQRLQWEALSVVNEAANELGIPSVDDFNRGDNFGCGYFDVSQRRGWRLNAFQAYVQPIRSRLTVITEAQVAKLMFDDPTDSLKCTGLQYFDASRPDHPITATADAEVILCAGAVGSVQILERSGIGCSKRLSQIPGVTPRVNLRGVGENFQDHLQLRASFKVDGLPTLNSIQRTLIGKLKIGMEYVIWQTGPMSMAPSQLGIFAHSSPAHERPNVEFHVQPLSLDRFGEPLHDYDAITASVCNLRPTSRGSVHITSADPASAPCIQPRSGLSSSAESS